MKKQLIAVAILAPIVASIAVGVICYGVGAENTRRAMQAEFTKVLAELEEEYAEQLETKSFGEIGKETYSIEIWEGTGQIVIKTTQRYLRQLEDGTLMIQGEK